MEGKLIVIEGIDGAGKATQAKILKEQLESQGKTVSVYSYPDYSSVYGERIKSFLYKKIDLKVDELFMLYLIDMVKDRNRIIEDIKKGNDVLIDRFFFSTIAYQSAGGFSYETGKEFVKLLGMPPITVVFYINVPVDISMQRKEKQKGKMDVDKFESNKMFLSNVSKVYDQLKSENFYAKKWVEIDGSKSIEEISSLIKENMD
ncbi:MAG: thymidylate kinase [Candidatus Parvarchaeum acidiphilum ARMAN-4]|jgi:dTMP kinase|uniref:Probable thymidylate kinase n=1 Tax=Candidatus Parvarchaeum acidiphilum ARMAN-4 TaxID=662760 RepID=D2EGP0_PARA4|nr:MAG: thymidylate kinase [Candidatus Parvarchaeum acidiphilum ARMAN-4]